MDKLIEFTKAENERLMKVFNLEREKIRYPMLVKIMEEIGELSHEILKKQGLVRKEKREGLSKVEEEIADVIITTFILAQNLGIDAKEAIAKKVEIIKTREY